MFTLFFIQGLLFVADFDIWCHKGSSQKEPDKFDDIMGQTIYNHDSKHPTFEGVKKFAPATNLELTTQSPVNIQTEKRVKNQIKNTNQ